jgi:hypothetical protein
MTTPSPAAPRPLGWLPSRILAAGLLLSIVATALLGALDNDAFLTALLAAGVFALLLTALPAGLFLFYSRRQPPPELPRANRVAVWFSALALVFFGVLLVGFGGSVESLFDQIVGVAVGLLGIVTIVSALRFKAPQSSPTRLAHGRASVVGALFLFFVVVITPKFACGCGTKEKAYRAEVKSDLRNLVTAQEAFFVDHHRFGSMAELVKTGVYAATTGDTIVIVAADAHGWSATGRNWNLADTCGIWVGTKPADGMHGAREQEAVCWEEKS